MAPTRKSQTMKPRKDGSKKSPALDYHHFDASFRVWGPDTDIEELSAITGLRPSETHRKGDRRGNGKWKDTMWSFRSTRPETSALEEHLNHLLDALEPLKDKIQRTIRARSRGLFWCAHYTNARDGNAGVTTLSAKILRRLADFGFDWAVDTYVDCD